MDRREDIGATMGDRGSEVPLRAVMSCFPTGVTIVAACDEAGVPRGLTVNSFTSVAVEPPLVLVCLSRESNSHDHLIEAACFTVSILSGKQADIADRFARHPSEGRFDGVAWRPAPSGHPVVSGAVAWLDCEIEEVVRAGDHSILLGRAVAAEVGPEAALVFHRGAFGSIGE